MDVSIILQLNESAFSNKKTGTFENILAKNLWSCNEIRNSLVGLFLDTVQSHKIFQSGRKLLCKKHWNKITSKRDAQRIFIFNKSKTFQKKTAKGPRFFVFQKHIKISTLKLCRFSIHWYCIKKINQSDVIFYRLRLLRKKYIKLTSIFCPLKLRQSVLIEMNLIFSQ